MLLIVVSHRQNFIQRTPFGEHQRVLRKYFPYSVKRRTTHEISILQEKQKKKKQIFKKLLFLLQMNYVRYPTDSGNTMLIAQTVHLQ
jgi:hypothetical protein